MRISLQWNIIWRCCLRHSAYKWQGEYQIENGFVEPGTIAKFKETFEEYGMKTVVT